jgi:hypothetical protein
MPFAATFLNFLKISKIFENLDIFESFRKIEKRGKSSKKRTKPKFFEKFWIQNFFENFENL